MHEIKNHNITDKANGLYIHIPFCVSKCKYCDFFSVPVNKIKKQYKCEKQSLIPQEYIDSLCSEIDYRLSSACSDYSLNRILLDTVYIGGGTPSLLTKNQLKQIIFHLKHSSFITLHNACEISIEINPDDVTPQLLQDYEECGITRISCGIQSMNDVSLKNVQRRSSNLINSQAVELLSQWKKELSIDFICTLPYENEKTFLDGIDFVISHLNNLNHISMYSLTIEEETPLGKEYNDGVFSYDFEKADDIWIKARSFLEKNGFLQYEVSNFCKHNKKCLHNLKYWNHEDYFGIGAGATGTLYNYDGSGIRWNNVDDISKYISFWENFDEQNQNAKPFQITEIITTEISEFEYFMMGMRKISGISKNHFEQTFHHELQQKFLLLCEEWQKKGLCIIKNFKDDTIFTLGKNGILFLNKFLENLV